MTPGVRRPAEAGTGTVSFYFDGFERALSMNKLGTINAAVLTVEHLRGRGIPVRGIVLNHFHPGDIMEEDNLAMIEAITEVKVVATVQSGDETLEMDADALAALYN